MLAACRSHTWTFVFYMLLCEFAHGGIIIGMIVWCWAVGPVESKVSCQIYYERFKCWNCVLAFCTLAFVHVWLVMLNWSEQRGGHRLCRWDGDNLKDHQTWLTASEFTGIEKWWAWSISYWLRTCWVNESMSRYSLRQLHVLICGV